MQEDCPKSTSLPFPVINTLKVDLLSENSTKFISCTPNGREPVPFETEFFKGVAVLIIRTSPVDEYFKSFFMGKYGGIQHLNHCIIIMVFLYVVGGNLKCKFKGNSKENLWEKYM